MAFTTLSTGLTIKVPTAGTRGWDATLLTDTWAKIASHTHDGAGLGAAVKKLAAGVALTEYGTTLTPSGTTQTITFTNGSVQNISLASATGDVTLTLASPSSGGIYKLWITQGATFRDIIWPAAVKWPQGQKPILSSGAGKVDYVELYYNGSVYRGLWELDFS
jgi:hypothetical protein